MDEETISTKLTRKQLVFIEEYLSCWNGAEAGRRAGYAHPDRQASRLLRKVEVEQAIQKRMREKAMDADEVLFRLAEHARSDIGEFFDPAINMVDMRKAYNAGKTRLIKKIKQTVKTTEDEEVIFTEIELVDSQAALEKIGRVHKLFVDRHELSGNIDETQIVVFIPENGRDE